MVEVERQHAAYVDTLRDLGAKVNFLPPTPELSDGVFVEDTAVVTDDAAIITCPGAVTRRAEVETVDVALRVHHAVTRLNGAGTLDGGDVIRIGRTFYLGRSSRTNKAGAMQFAAWAKKLGFHVVRATFEGCLHLKTGCTFIPPESIVINPEWVDLDVFTSFKVIVVDPKEPFAANTLTLGRTTLVSASYPRTEKKLNAAGVVTRAVDISELHKAEAGLTCLSLIIPKDAKRPTTVAPVHWMN